MHVQVDSLSMIYELKKNDVLIDPIKTERFIVEEINDGHIILCSENEKRALRTVNFPTILKEKWKLEIAVSPNQALGQHKTS